MFEYEKGISEKNVRELKFKMVNLLPELCRHYGFSHRVIFALMRDELGDAWNVDNVADDLDCQICQQV